VKSETVGLGVWLFESGVLFWEGCEVAVETENSCFFIWL